MKQDEENKQMLRNRHHHITMHLQHLHLRLPRRDEVLAWLAQDQWMVV
jgi:hypothetical protein